MRRLPPSLARAALALAGAFAAAVGAPALAAPVSSAITYQGELYDEGTPFVGTVDLRFTPYADGSNPALLGAPVVVEDVLVSGGVFTARVDFGAGFFVGDAVFLEIAVRPADATDPNAFEVLTPRQEITAAPYALKPAPGSVTDIELAGDAVGSPQIADASVASADVADGSLGPQDLALASGGFDGALWRVGGNAGSAGSLGVLDAGQSLNLVGPRGVTINGANVNGNTELTVRGNPNTPETNADLSLWPRGGEAFFNFGVVGQTPADTRLQIHSVGTNPFTGFTTRAQLNFDGSLGLGGNAVPHARLHVKRTAQGFDAPADSSENLELVLEDADAQLGLYSDAVGGAGSVIGLAEMNANAFVNQWGLFRATSGAGSALQLSFGTNTAAAGNPVLAQFGTNASLALGAPAVNADTELQVAGSPATPGGPADLALVPQGGTALFNLSASGTNETNTALALQFAGPGFNYEPRARFAANGAVGLGRFAGTTQPDSYVFADDSSASTFAASAPNQFLIRATGGVAIDGPPIQSSYELSVHGHAAGSNADFAMLPGGSETGYVVSVAGADLATSSWRLLRRDSSAGLNFVSRLWFASNGFLGVNSGFSDPAFPLEIGTNGTNGNGAHVTAGGTWTNGSSRAFKEAFTAIDTGDILQRVLALPVTRWRYRGGEDAWHLGPVAEDFRAAFGLGGDGRYIGTVDADGVALAAIQGLAQREESRAAALQRENARLRAALEALVERVEALERGE